MTDLHTSITDAFRYCNENGIVVPFDLYVRARRVGALKAGYAAGDLSAINAVYHDKITQLLTGFFEGGSITAPRNGFKQAASMAFLDAFETGWKDGGKALPLDADALDWLDARLNTEFGYIDMLMQEAKDLRKDKEFDFFTWITKRADGYVNRLKEIYNGARMRATPDMMVVFEGDDGAESCDTCQMLKGKKDKLSWFISQNYIPPFGTGLICHPGGRCQHGLKDMQGNWVTV